MIDNDFFFLVQLTKAVIRSVSDTEMIMKLISFKLQSSKDVNFIYTRFRNIDENCGVHNRGGDKGVSGSVDNFGSRAGSMPKTRVHQNRAPHPSEEIRVRSSPVGTLKSGVLNRWSTDSYGIHRRSNSGVYREVASFLGPKDYH